MVDFATLVLGAETAGLLRAGRDLDRLARQGEDTERRVDRSADQMGRSIADFTAQAARGLVGLVGGFVSVQGAMAALNMGRDFNAAMAEASTLIAGTASEMAALEAAARSMSREFGGTATAQVQGLYTALSSGASSIADAAKIMDSANRLAVGGAADAGIAVQLLSGIINAYGADVITAADASDVLFIGAQAGVTTISELSATLGTIIPTANAVGLELDEVVGGIAALTLNSMDTNAAVTSLNAALNAVAAPSQQAKQLAAELGLEFGATAINAQGLGGFLESVADATGGNIEQMSILFGSVEALKTALLFAGEAGGQYADIMGLMEQRTGATDAAVAKMVAGLDQRLTVATAKMLDVALSVGNVLLAVFVPAMEAAAAVLVLARDNADILGIALGVLAASYIPSSIGAVIGLVSWLGAAQGAMAAGTLAAQGLAFALNAIPFAAVVTVAAGVYRGFTDSTAAASDYAGALDTLSTAHGTLETATSAFYENMTAANLAAMQSAAQAARDTTAATLHAAKAELEAASFFTNFFGASLFETERMAAARAAIAELEIALIEAEGRVQAADHSAANFAGTLVETETAAGGVTTMITAASNATFAAIPAMADLRAEYGGLADTMRDVLTAQNDLAAADARAGFVALARQTAGLADNLQVGVENADAFLSRLALISGQNTFANQSRYLADMATYIANASGGLDQMDAETRAVYQSLLETSAQAADLAVASGEMQVGLLQAAQAASGLAGGLGGALGVAQSLAASLWDSANAAFAAAQASGWRGQNTALGDDERGSQRDEYLSVQAHRSAQAMQAATQRAGEYQRALRGVESASGGAAGSGGASAATQLLETRITAMDAALAAARDPLRVFNDGLAELNELAAFAATEGVDFGRAYAHGLQQLNDELFQSIPLAGDLVDTLTSGLMTGFRGTLDDLGGLFRDWLAEMIATAAKNAIALRITASGPDAVAGAAPNILSGLMGSFGTGQGLAGLAGGSGLLGGMGNVIGGLGSGGLSGAFAGLQTALGGGFASAVGGLIPVVGAAALVLSAFRKQTTLLDAGLRVTVDGMDAMVETFRRTETSSLFGLIRSRSTGYGAASADVADPVVAAVAGIQSGVLDAARALGIGTAAFAGFSAQIRVSTKGMTDDQAAQAVTEALAGLGDEFALMTPGLRALIRDGETATAALTRLTTSLAAVNDAADLLGHRLLPASLAGGNLASVMVDAAGGLDAFGRGVQSYFDGFYTAEERLAAQTRRLSVQMADLGLVMPRSRAEFRRMVEGIDTTTAAGAALYGQVMALAGALDGVLPSIAGLTAELVALQGNVQTGLDAAITAAQAAAQANAAAAADWYRASGSIREYIDRLRGTAGALTSPVQAQAYNQARYQTTLAAAMAGDLQAAQDISGVAETLRQSSLATARTRVDAARTEARILSDLSLLSGVGDIEGARHDVIAGLLGQQVTLLQEARAAIASGAALTAAQIATLTASLGGLDDAIAEAQLLNYAYLKERLAVSVEVLADAKVPAYVRTLLRNAATGIEADIDFLVRSDLTPDLKWLALTASSEHVKTVEYLAQNDLGSNLTRIALATASTLKKTVNLVIGADLTAADKRLALAGSSELLRTVNAVLDADIDPRAMRLALANVGAYDVAVRAALDKTVGTQVRRIVFGETGTYAALVKAALDPNLGPNVRRILLDQQGQYAVNVTGTLGADVPDAMRALILKANTAGARAITIATVFGDKVTAAQRALLVRESSEALRMISAVVNPLQVTPDELIFLRQLAETGSVKRTLDAALQTGDTSRTGLSLLTQLGLGSGVVARALDARVDLADLGVSDARILRQLDAGAGEVYRAIDGRMFGQTGTWTRDAILAQLAAGEGRVARAVDGQVFASTGTWTRNALLAQLAAGEGSVARSIDGQVFATTGTWTRSALLTQLAAGEGSVGRSIDGRMFATTGTWTREQFLAQLAAGEGAITRTINGIVATGTLSAAQLALLSAITGASDGKLTLGGTFAFDPTTGFRTWYETSTRAAITTPMDTLRAAMGTLGTSLSSLRAALIAEADRQTAATGAAQVAALGRATADMARNDAGQIIATDAQIRALATTAGVGTGGSAYDMVSRLTGLSATDDVTGIARDASGYASKMAYRAKFAALKGAVDIDPLGYLAAYPWVAESALTPAQHFDRVGRARILAGDYSFDPAAFDWASVGLDIPAFAGGGLHAGGLRIVGENGPELEATGPSRIWSAPQTSRMLGGDDAGMLAELRALRAEVASLRDEQRQLGLQTVGNTRRAADVLRKFDIDGLPAERV